MLEPNPELPALLRYVPTVNAVVEAFVAVSKVFALSKVNPATPPEIPAGVPAVVVQNGIRVAVSALDVATYERRLIVPELLIVPPERPVPAVMLVTVPAALERQTPFIAKHPVRISMPLPNVEVAVAEILMVFAPVLPSESRVPGVVVPMPTFEAVDIKIVEVARTVLLPL